MSFRFSLLRATTPRLILKRPVRMSLTSGSATPEMTSTLAKSRIKRQCANKICSWMIEKNSSRNESKSCDVDCRPQRARGSRLQKKTNLCIFTCCLVADSREHFLISALSPPPSLPPSLPFPPPLSALNPASNLIQSMWSKRPICIAANTIRFTSLITNTNHCDLLLIWSHRSASLDFCKLSKTSTRSSVFFFLYHRPPVKVLLPAFLCLVEWVERRSCSHK